MTTRPILPGSKKAGWYNHPSLQKTNTWNHDTSLIQLPLAELIIIIPRSTLILKNLILISNYTESRTCSGKNPRLGAIIMMTAQISNPSIVLP